MELAACDNSEDHACCHHHAANPSVHQSLDELDFDRGIWSAALYGDEAKVEKILSQEKRFDVNGCDKAGYTALHYASRSGHVDVCKILLAHGARVNAITASTKATPLHRAAYMGHTEIISLLLAHGADITALDCDEKTPLDKAQEKGSDSTREILTRAKAS